VLARKRELVARSDVLRRALGEHADGLAPAFAAGDKLAGFGRSLLSRPLVLIGAGALLLALFPRAVLGLAARGFALWKGAAAARRLLASRG
jgi:hypothetical protein